MDDYILLVVVKGLGIEGNGCGCGQHGVER
jgi:hypothetical protein